MIAKLMELLSLFFNKESLEVTKVEKPEEKQLITLDAYLSSSGKYPDRAKSPENTPELRKNAEELLKRVNKALTELGVTSAVVSSGFRTKASNASLANSATRSAHMTMEAIDLVDDEKQSLCKLFTKEVLIRHDLRREDSDYTKGARSNWCHLDIKPVKFNRIFKP